eukprot:Em0007g1398a
MAIRVQLESFFDTHTFADMWNIYVKGLPRVILAIIQGRMQEFAGHGADGLQHDWLQGVEQDVIEVSEEEVMERRCGAYVPLDLKPAQARPSATPPGVENENLQRSMRARIMATMRAETYGAWGKEAMEAFSQLASQLATHACRLKSAVTFELYSRLNLHLNWIIGKPAAFDFTVTSSLNLTTLTEAGVTRESAAMAAEVQKHGFNDCKCSELGWVSIPLAQSTISRLESRLAIQLQCSKSKAITTIYQRLNITLIRANTRALLSHSGFFRSEGGV